MNVGDEVDNLRKMYNNYEKYSESKKKLCYLAKN